MSTEDSKGSTDALTTIDEFRSAWKFYNETGRGWDELSALFRRIEILMFAETVEKEGL